MKQKPREKKQSDPAICSKTLLRVGVLPPAECKRAVPGDNSACITPEDILFEVDLPKKTGQSVEATTRSECIRRGKGF